MGRFGNWATPHFQAEPIINPQMKHSGRRCARFKIPLRAEILPVIKHRLMSSMPELATERPNDARMRTTLGEALTPLKKTGSEKGAQRASAKLSIAHEMRPA